MMLKDAPRLVCQISLDDDPDVSLGHAVFCEIPQAGDRVHLRDGIYTVRSREFSPNARFAGSDYPPFDYWTRGGDMHANAECTLRVARVVAAPPAPRAETCTTLSQGLTSVMTFLSHQRDGARELRKRHTRAMDSFAGGVEIGLEDALATLACRVGDGPSALARNLQGLRDQSHDESLRNGSLYVTDGKSHDRLGKAHAYGLVEALLVTLLQDFPQ